MRIFQAICLIGVFVIMGTISCQQQNHTTSETQNPQARLVAEYTIEKTPVKEVSYDRPIKPIPDYLAKGIDWLAEVQFENGGWGAGQHSAQHVRDARAVQVDPATTAFSAMALLRSGSTLQEGKYKDNVANALELLLEMTEQSDKNHPNITTIQGTQPQGKLGQNIDVSMAAQFFARILPHTAHNTKLENRTRAALEKCVQKMEQSQKNDGSWNDGGWAPVLQSAMANNALEMSRSAGIDVDDAKLKNSRRYQSKNYNTSSGSIATDKAAGIELYSYASTQRATAEEAESVRKIIKKAEKRGKKAPKTTTEIKKLLEDEGVKSGDAETITQAYQANEAATNRLQDESVLSGFGNNGGEEFLSYMMTSESFVRADDKQWDDWHGKMNKRLGKIQNSNGSWSGHHCITSPVFCTAAVIMTLTADRDEQLLKEEAKKEEQKKK